MCAKSPEVRFFNFMHLFFLKVDGVGLYCRQQSLHDGLGYHFHTDDDAGVLTDPDPNLIDVPKITLLGKQYCQILSLGGILLFLIVVTVF